MHLFLALRIHTDQMEVAWCCLSACFHRRIGGLIYKQHQCLIVVCLTLPETQQHSAFVPNTQLLGRPFREIQCFFIFSLLVNTPCT